MSDPNFRESPKGSTIISDAQLEHLVYEVVDQLPKDSAGSVSVSIEEIEANLYNTVLAKLRSNRFFYPGLNPKTLLRMLHSVSTSFSFTKPKGSSSSMMDEYDILVSSKVNGLPYNSSRLEALRVALGFG